MTERTYLGDGVYAHQEHGDVVLVTSDGERDTNTIVLEPEVLQALLRYVLPSESYERLRSGG